MKQSDRWAHRHPTHTKSCHSDRMAAFTDLPTDSSPRRRARLWWEIAIVLSLSLGRSAVYSVLSLIEALTRAPLSGQQTSLNPGAAPSEVWDVISQFLSALFGFAPVALAIYLLMPASLESALVLPLLGAAIGIMLGVVTHAMTRKRREFSSVQQVMASRYDIVAPQHIAGRAMHVVGQRGAAAPVTAPAEAPAGHAPETPQA